MKETKIKKILKKIIFRPNIVAENQNLPLPEIKTPHQTTVEDVVTSLKNTPIYSTKATESIDTINKMRTLAISSPLDKQTKFQNILLLIDTIYLEGTFSENIRYLDEITKQIFETGRNFDIKEQEQIETKITEKYQEAIQEAVLNKDFEEKILRQIPKKYIINIFMQRVLDDTTDPYEFVTKKIHIEHTKMKILGHH